MVSVVYIILLPAWPLLSVLRLLKYLVLVLLTFVQRCIWTVLSIPVILCCAAGARMKRVWNFSKARARLLLMGRSTSAIKGTQTLEEDDEEPAALEDVEEEGDEQLARTLTAVATVVRRRSGGGKRLSHTERRTMVETLIKLLLQSSSPRQSDDEEEVPSLPTEQHGEAGRSLRLILDLMKLSNTRMDIPPEVWQQSSTSSYQTRHQPRYRHVKEREGLQSLISELDHLATEVDPSVLLPGKKSKPTTTTPPPSSPEEFITPEVLTETGEEEEEVERRDRDDVPTSSDEQTQSEEEEDEEEAPKRPPTSYLSVLSPVHESPELSVRSVSEESVSQMESDLNSVLFRLHHEAGELETLGQTMEASGVAPEWPLAQTVAEFSSGQETSLPPLPPPVSMDTVPEPKRSHNDSRVHSSVSTEGDFQSIPQTPPFLGVKVGHDRRDLAIAIKRRPPTRRNSRPEQPSTTEVKRDSEEEDTPSSQGSELTEFDEEEEEEGGTSAVRMWVTAGTTQALPPPHPLDDQIRLLKPGSVNLEEEEEEEEEAEERANSPSLEEHVRPTPMTYKQEMEVKANLEAKVIPQPKATAEQPKEEKEEEDKGMIMRARLRLGGDLSLGGQPPWLEMRKPNLPPPIHPPRPPVQPTTPPRPPREPTTQDCPLSPTYDVLAPKRVSTALPPPVPPRRPVAEPTYDCLVPKRPLPPVPPPQDLYDSVFQPQYLHEAVAMRRPSESESTPELPPRNPPVKTKSDEKKERSSRSRERRSAEEPKSKLKGKESSSKRHTGSISSSTSRSRSRERSTSLSSRTSSEKRLKAETKKSAASPSTSRRLFSSSPKEVAKKQSSSKEKEKERKSKSKGESPKSSTPKAKRSTLSDRSPQSKGSGKDAEATPVYRTASKLSLTSGATPSSSTEMKKSTSLTSLRHHGSFRGAGDRVNKQTTV